MLNSVILLGRLAQDPELKQTTSGKSVTSFDIAVQVPSADRSAPPDYIPIVCWNGTAEMACRHLAKGRQIVVEGRLSTRKYTDNDGNPRKVMEVIASRLHFADSKPAEATQSTGGFGSFTQNAAPLSGFGQTMEPVDDEDDDLPF